MVPGGVLAGVVSTFHVRTIVFCILMMHASNYYGFDGQVFAAAAAAAIVGRVIDWQMNNE